MSGQYKTGVPLLVHLVSFVAVFFGSINGSIGGSKLLKPICGSTFSRLEKVGVSRIYNSSEEEIEALNIRVIFPDEEYHVQWDSQKDMFPSLKRHGSFDIYALIYTSTHSHTTVRIEWNQEGSNKVFSTLETVSLD